MYCDRRLGGIKRWYLNAPKDAEMRIPNSMLECACFLCVEIDGELKTGGTAFFLSFASRQAPITWHYLVTAKHCIVQARKYKKLFVRMNTRDGPVIAEVPDNWIFPEDVGSDVAILPFSDDPSFRFSPIDFNSAADQKALIDQSIGIGNEVLIIGLFTHRGGVHKNIPIVRSGILAAMPEEPIYDGKTGSSYNAYLIEARSLSGLSGSPVFVHVPHPQLDEPWKKRYPGGFLFLLGLIRGHFDEPPFVDSVDGAPRRLNTGIATVTPIWEVIETVKSNKTIRETRERDVKRFHEEHSETLDASFDESGPIFTKDDFENALKKVSRKLPTEAKSGS
jgi:hypothetical protein